MFLSAENPISCKQGIENWNTISKGLFTVPAYSPIRKNTVNYSASQYASSEAYDALKDMVTVFI
jgi:hypothetical protein